MRHTHHALQGPGNVLEEEEVCKSGKGMGETCGLLTFKIPQGFLSRSRGCSGLLSGQTQETTSGHREVRYQLLWWAVTLCSAPTTLLGEFQSLCVFGNMLHVLLGLWDFGWFKSHLIVVSIYLQRTSVVFVPTDPHSACLPTDDFCLLHSTRRHC